MPSGTYRVPKGHIAPKVYRVAKQHIANPARDLYRVKSQSDFTFEDFKLNNENQFLLALAVVTEAIIFLRIEPHLFRSRVYVVSSMVLVLKSISNQYSVS